MITTKSIQYRQCVLTLLLVCSTSIQSIAQITSYSFENNLDDIISSYDGVYLNNGEEIAIDDTVYTDAITNKGISLSTFDGIQLPVSLAEQLVSSSSFEVEFDFIYIEGGNGNGRKILFSLKQNTSWVSSGIVLSACTQCPFFDPASGGKFDLRLLYADGRDATQGSDYSYFLDIGEFSIGEQVKVNLIIDFENRNWIVKANEKYLLQQFDDFFDMEYFKANLSDLNPHIGWINYLEDKISYAPEDFTGTVIYDNFNFFVPQKPSSVPVLKEALVQMTEHILGNNTLSPEDQQNYTSEIFINAAFNYQQAKSEIDAYLSAFESNYPPLFEDINTVNVSLLSNEERIAITLQQDIHDNEFVTGNIEQMAGIKFEAAEVFPGIVDAGAPRIENASTQINSTYITDPGYKLGKSSHIIRPSGYYAAAGEVITINVPVEAVSQGISILVGAHSWDLTTKMSKLNRFPRISKEFEIISAQTKVGNPFGGGIYIRIPDGVDLGWINVSISGAVKSPFFRHIDGYETSLADWQEDITNAHVLWADVESEKMMFTIPTITFNSIDLSDIMSTWDKMWDAVQVAAGRPLEKTRSEYLLIDRRLPYDSFGAGYPMILNEKDAPFGNYANSWWNPLRVLNSNYVQSSGAGIITHELGHNMGYPTPPEEAETVVQMVGIPMYNVGLNQPIDTATSYVEDETHTRDMAAINWMIAYNFRNNNPMYTDPSRPDISGNELRYQIRGGMKYVDIAMLYGWDKLGSINKLFYDQWTNDGWEESNAPHISREQYIQAATEGIGENITPLLHFWGYIPSENQKIELDAYPKSEQIFERLLYYKELAPKTKDEFQIWHDLLRPTVDPVHYDRYDWTLANFDSENIGQAISDQIDFILSYYTPVIIYSSTLNICDGDSVYLQEEWQYNSGVFQDTLLDISRNDSIVATTLIVNPIYSIAKNVSICSGEDYTYPDGTTEGNIVKNVVHKSLLESLATGCDSIVTTNVVVLEINTNVSTEGSTLTAGEAKADTYQWLDCELDNAPIDGATNFEFSAPKSGDYALVIEKDGCTETSACITLVITGLEDVGALVQRIWPNPSTGNVNIHLNENNQILELFIQDISGRVLLHKDVASGETNFRTELPAASGVYFIRLKSDEKTATYKIIKK